MYMKLYVTTNEVGFRHLIAGDHVYTFSREGLLVKHHVGLEKVTDILSSCPLRPCEVISVLKSADNKLIEVASFKGYEEIGLKRDIGLKELQELENNMESLGYDNFKDYHEGYVRLVYIV